MNSPTKLPTLFKFPQTYPQNNNTANVISQIPYALLPNIPITPHSNINTITNINVPNLNNMPIPPPPSAFDFLSPKQYVSPNKYHTQTQLLNNTIHTNNNILNTMNSMHTLTTFTTDDDSKIFENKHKTNTPYAYAPTNISETNQNIQLTQTELMNAIDTEKKKTILKTQMVAQLHKEYDIKLQRLKNKLMKLKQKTAIIDNIKQTKYRESLEKMLMEKQKIYNSFVLTQSSRLHDQQQLKIVNGQNKNLQSIVDSLSKQLRNVINHYQHLCNQQNEQSNFSFMGNINGQYHNQRLFEPDCSAAMGNNAHFQQMLCDNRRLERQIKFLRHIIQKETARNKFNNV